MFLQWKMHGDGALVTQGDKDVVFRGVRLAMGAEIGCEARLL